MADWRAWNRFDWNERLFEHYFGGCGPALTRLLVTAEELQLVTGDKDAEPSAVRDAFVEKIRRAVDGDLLGHAKSQNSLFPDSPKPSRLPGYFAHLVFTCLAAAESNDDLADEGSFLARLDLLAGCSILPARLSLLPKLWTGIQAWLAANSDRYRQLVLPEVGGLTRIGYSVILTFPDRRDLQQLSELIDANDLAGDPPPMPEILGVVVRNRQHFRPSMNTAADEYARSGSRDDPTHRFYAAVVEAIERGRGNEDIAIQHPKFQLCCFDEDGHLELVLLSDGSSPGRFGIRPLDEPVGDWAFVVERADGDDLGAVDVLKEGGVSAVAALFDGSASFDRLSELVSAGVLPFIQHAEGHYELANASNTQEATMALVSQSRLGGVCAAFQAPGRAARQSVWMPGWVRIEGLAWRPLAIEDLRKFGLETCRLLLRRRASFLGRPVGGVRVDGAYLGFAQVLPVISWPGAVEVLVGTHRLEREGEYFRFFPGGYEGLVEVRAKLNDGTQREMSVHFVEIPIDEGYKRPNVRSLTDGIGGSRVWGVEDRPQAVVDVSSAVDAIVLGRNVGEAGAALPHWRVWPVGGRGAIEYIGEANGDRRPTTRTASDGARRRWRRAVLNDVALWDSLSTRKALRSTLRPDLDLPIDESLLPFLSFATDRFDPPKRNTLELVAVISGLSRCRAGIPWSTWRDLELSLLGTSSFRGHILRAWSDGGFVDITTLTAWKGKQVIAREPELVAFRLGAFVAATVRGLAIPSTLERVRAAASSAGWLIQDVRSVSSFVPSTVRIMGPSEQGLEQIAKKSGLGVALLGSIPRGPRRVEDGPIPMNYEAKRWKWIGSEMINDDISLLHHTRRDSPPYWSAVTAQHQFWSFQLDAVLAWTAAMRGRPIVEQHHLGLQAAGGYVPTDIARWIAAVSAGLPGPTDNGYLYPAGTELARTVACVIAAVFTPELGESKSGRKEHLHA